MQSFGQVIPVLGPGAGFPGQWSRTADTLIISKQVLSTTATNLPFGSGAVLIPASGTLQSLADFLGTASNAQFLQQYFAGIAVRNVKVSGTYAQYAQSAPTAVTTTATQATPGSTTIVVASATGITVGQSVEGAGLQANTLVTGVSGTTITISLSTLIAMSSTNVAFISTTPPAVGFFSAGQMGEVMVRSSISVLVAAGTPQYGSALYIRTVANASTPGTSVGDFEAAAEQATSSITITTTLGSTTLTTSAGTGLAIGQMVTGPGIAANTYLTAGATTSWTMSQGAVAAVTAGAAVFYNTALLGTVTDPFVVFNTNSVDANNVAEVVIKNRHAA